MGRHGRHQARSGARAGWILGAAAVALVVAVATVWVILRPGREGTAVSDRSVDVAAASTDSAAPTSPAPTGGAEGTDGTTVQVESTSVVQSVGPADTCGDRDPLSVATTPALAPVLMDLAEEACVDLDVTEVTDVGGASLLQSGEVDVWLPAGREYGSVAGEQAWSAPPLAWSPVVLSADEDTAEAAAAAGPVSWSALLVTQGQLGGLPVELAPLSGGASFSVSGLLLQLSTAGTGDQRTALAATAAALAGLIPMPDGQERTPVPAGSLRITEYRDALDSGAAVVPTAEGYPVLEAPWIAADPTMPAAESLLEAASGEVGAAILRDHGLVAPGVEKVAGRGLPAGAPLATSSPETAPLLWAITGTGSRPGRTLAVLDVSGSMGEVQADGLTPMDGVKASAPLLFGGLAPETAVGLWIFGNQLNPPADWSELVPIAPLRENGPAIQQALGDLQPRRTGSSLNATVLDAYRQMQSTYDPAATNILGVFTDGREEDAPLGIDLPTLQAELAAIADPNRPVVMLFFAYGAADPAVMEQIVAANGGLGGVWKIDQPQHIIGALIEATASTLTFE